MSPELNTSGPAMALCDCNAMFVSSQLIFEPWLQDMPVVVLSTNDGNAIARNSYAKALGIKMGHPWHELAPLHAKGQLKVYSANFALYQTVSEKVMAVLARHAARMEVYSVDEAWLAPPTINGDLEPWAREVREAVLKQVGMPTGIGIGTTKTMAKLANWAAKRWVKQTGNVVDIRHPGRLEKLLKCAPVSEVWGVGSRLTQRLERDLSITTAWQLATAERRLLRRLYGVTMERTARELCGQRCFGFEEGPEPQQQIISSQSFGQRVHDKATLAAAIATYIGRAAAKMRRQGSVAHCLRVFVRTSSFARSGEPYSASDIATFAAPTDDTRELIAAAMSLLERIYREGPAYAKAGIVLSQLVPARHRTDDLFAPGRRAESPALMGVLDDINLKMGRGTVRLARESAQSGWEMRRQFLSPYYTTRWDDLPRVR